METLPKKRSFFSKLGLNREEAFFSPALKHFIEESRKCQTLYANCEGSYSRRIMNLKDRNTLENFVYCTMYYDGVHSRHNEKNFLKCEHVKKISEQMINIGKEFDLEGQIHFGVIWVYYFCYEDKTEKAAPVFKIFKRVIGKEAVYLDTSLTLYQSWDNYLDCAEFPLSFLCFPRNGEYYFLDGDQGENARLDLEFLFMRRFISWKENCFDALIKAGFVPFCQVTVRPLLIKIINFTVEKMKQVKQIICILWAHINKHKCSMLKAAVFGSLLLLKMKNSEVAMGERLQTLLLDELMLLNSELRESSLENSFSLSDVSDAHQALEDLEFEVVTLKELLGQPRKDWVQILGLVCSIFKRGRPVLNYISSLLTLPGVLKIILLLLTFLDGAQEAGPLKDREKSSRGSEVTEGQEIKDDVTLLLGHRVSSSRSNESQQIDSFQSQKCSGNTEMALKVINKMTLEKTYSNLFLLETDSAEKAQNRLVQESVFELHEKRLLLGPEDLSCNLFLEEKDGYGIFFMARTSLPQLTLDVSQLIGKGFSFKPEESNTFNVILSSGKLAGTLFFPLEFSAIGVFSMEAIREESKLKPLALEGSR